MGLRVQVYGAAKVYCTSRARDVRFGGYTAAAAVKGAVVARSKLQTEVTVGVGLAGRRTCSRLSLPWLALHDQAFISSFQMRSAHSSAVDVPAMQPTTHVTNEGVGRRHFYVG